jgi:hypothetical protein
LSYSWDPNFRFRTYSHHNPKSGVPISKIGLIVLKNPSAIPNPYPNGAGLFCNNPPLAGRMFERGSQQNPKSVAEWRRIVSQQPAPGGSQVGTASMTIAQAKIGETRLGTARASPPLPGNVTASSLAGSIADEPQPDQPQNASNSPGCRVMFPPRPWIGPRSPRIPHPKNAGIPARRKPGGDPNS